MSNVFPHTFRSICFILVGLSCNAYISFWTAARIAPRPPLVVAGWAFDRAIPGFLFLVLSIVLCVRGFRLLIRWKNSVSAQTEKPFFHRLVYYGASTVFVLWLLCTPLVLLGLFFNSESYAPIPAQGNSACTAFFSEQSSLMRPYYFGRIYLMKGRSGIPTDTGYVWTGGKKHGHDVLTIHWESTIGIVEPMKSLEPLHRLPARLECP